MFNLYNNSKLLIFLTLYLPVVSIILCIGPLQTVINKTMMEKIKISGNWITPDRRLKANFKHLNF